MLRVLRSAAACGLVMAVLAGCDSDADVGVEGHWVPDRAFVTDRAPAFDVRDAIVSFDDDGEWEASDGCNELSGEFDIDGQDWSATAGSVVGVGCVWGSVAYESIFVGETERIEREGDELRFVDDEGNLVLRLFAYSGRPRPYEDVDYKDLLGAWRPVEIFGERVSVGDDPYGYLVVGREETSTIRGCREYHGQLNLGPGGGISPRFTSLPGGCDLHVGLGDLGPNTARVLKKAVRMQIRSNQLAVFDEDRVRIARYVRVRED